MTETQTYATSSRREIRTERSAAPAREHLSWVVVRITAANLCRAALALLASLAACALLPFLWGWHPTVVMSDSMTPDIRTGDVVVVMPVPDDELTPGRVIQFDDPDHADRLRLHRIVSVADGELITRGDANDRDDSSPVTISSVHGVGFLLIPRIGLPVQSFADGDPIPGVASIAAVGLLAVGARADRRYRHSPGENE
jgi:signal peptidase I